MALRAISGMSESSNFKMPEIAAQFAAYNTQGLSVGLPG